MSPENKIEIYTYEIHDIEVEWNSLILFFKF